MSKKQFMLLHNLPIDTLLTINEISILSGTPENALQMIYDRYYISNTIEIQQFSFNKKKVTKPFTSRIKEKNAFDNVYKFVMKDKKSYNDNNDIRLLFNLE